MTSTFLGLQIGQSALESSRLGLQTAAHNIANANTPGYAREVANIQEANSLVTYTDHQSYLGQGTIGTNQTRVTNPYVNQEYRDNNAQSSYWNTQSTEISNISQIYNEPTGTTLRQSIDGFFTAWNTLGGAPSDGGARSAVLETAKNVTDAFHTVSNSLTANQTRYLNQAIDTTSQINNLASSIAEITTQIQKAQQSGDAPNDLMDQRSNLLDQLSQYAAIGVTYSPDTNNPAVTDITVTLKGNSAAPGSFAGTLVQNGTANSIAVPNASNSAQVQTFLTGIAGLQDKSGTLTSLADMYNYAGAQLTSVDKLASQLATDVNTGQANGYEYNSSTAGPALLTASGGGAITASNIQVASSFTANDLAAATSANAPTDGSNAQAIAAQYNSPIDQQYASIVNTLGDDGQAAQLQNQTFSALTTQVSSLKQSISGVNINEEMTKMVQYQQTYDAAARFVQTFSSMLSTLISEVH